ncbi:hypothetical protein ACFSX5_00255 [Devosia albogilva]|uniref:Uncharacterized protein n=1 Tax=Devosia albogilva TaxID=429726 RepID=A0ABW5QF42_9HYPH
MPMMLTLIEAIAGRDRAQAVARDFGVEDWDARHASGNFRFTRDFATGVMDNALALWNRENLGVALYPGIDGLSLSLVADAWSRTYRSKATSFAPTAEIATANGIRVLADEITPAWPDQTIVSVNPGETATDALDRTLASIAGRYGDNTAEIVAMQLEYQMPPQAR